MAKIIIKSLGEQEPESWGGWAARNAARTGTTAASAVMGLPGDIVGLAETGVRAAQTGLNKLTGGYVPEPINKESMNPFITSSGFRKEFAEKSGGYLKARNSKEEFADDVTNDIISTLLPLGGKVPLKAAVRMGLGGNVASWIAKDMGAPEWVQGASKIGFNVLSGMAGTRNTLIKNQDTLRKNFDNVIRPMEKFRTPIVEPLVENAKKIATSGKGAKVGWKKEILDEAEAVESALAGKSFLDVKKSVAIEKDLTDELRKGKYSKEATKEVEKLRDGLKKANLEFAKSGENHEFAKYYLPYSEIDNGLNASSKVGQFIQKNISVDLAKKHKATSGGFLGSALYFSKIPLATKSIAGAAALKGGYNLFSLFAKSPIARKAYENAFKASLAQNKKTALVNINKFNNEANKYFPEHKIVIKKLSA